MKSKLSIKSILIIAIIGIVSMVYFNPSLAANTAKVNVETANIRKSADTNADIVEQANKDEEVEILEKSADWYKVKYNGVQGYLRKDLLNVAETTENSVVEDNTQAVETTTQASQEQQTVTEEQAKNETVETTSNTQNTEQTATETEKEETTTTGLYTCKEITKLKIMPLILGKDIKEINNGETLNVLEINNKWALVESGTNRGWVLVSKIEKVSEENAKVEENKSEEQKEEEEVKEEQTETPMYVNSEVINLRKEANTSSESITTLTKGTKVTVTGEVNGWSKVKVNNNEGYILSTLLSQTRPEITTSRNIEQPRQVEESSETESVAATSTTGSAAGLSVVDYAKSYIGQSPYVYGGSSPSGFDCSGFTSYVYSQYGVSLNRTAQGQYSNGTAVSKSELQVGDLVMFGTSSSNITHVGIYAGDGQIVHAANRQRGVTMDTINSGYYNNNYVGARRVAN